MIRNVIKKCFDEAGKKLHKNDKSVQKVFDNKIRQRPLFLNLVKILKQFGNECRQRPLFLNLVKILKQFGNECRQH